MAKLDLVILIYVVENCVCMKYSSWKGTSSQAFPISGSLHKTLKLILFLTYETKLQFTWSELSNIMYFMDFQLETKLIINISNIETCCPFFWQNYSIIRTLASIFWVITQTFLAYFYHCFKCSCMRHVRDLCMSPKKMRRTYIMCSLSSFVSFLS